jgi:autotransporter-associated beta strand protein
MDVLPFRNRHYATIKVASKPSAKQFFYYAASCFRLLLRVALCVFVLGLSAQASTVRTVGAYNITFYDSREGDDAGSGSQNWTSQQMEDVVACVAAWSSRITNINTFDRKVELHLFWNSLGNTILGQTSNQSSGDGTTTWSNTERIWREGEDYSSSTSYDARMSLSTGISWNTGTGTPSSSQYDLRSVITHELGHTLGFYSTYSYDSDTFSSSGLSEWDKLLVDKSGNMPVAGGTGTPDDFNQQNNPVYFTGTNAKAAYGGNNVPVYAPTDYSSGSSLSHLDQTLLPNDLMSPAISAGVSRRSPSTLDWAILEDLGWSVTDVQTWNKGAGTLNWSDAANWTLSAVPDSNYSITFTNTGISGGDTIVLGGDRTINAISINSTVNFTIGGGAGILTLNGGYITRSTTSSGTQTISRPLVVGANTVWDIGGTGSLTITGSLTASSSITKIGSGTVVLSGVSSVPDNLDIDNGDLTLTSGGSLTAGNLYGTAGSINIDGGTLTVTGTLDIYGFRVGKSGTGSFTLVSGKTLTAEELLTIGRDSGSSGTFINQGGTVIASTNLFSGANSGATGYYIQNSGSTTVTATTFAGYGSGSTGSITINGGSFGGPYIYTGYDGTGYFTQYGGTVNASYAMVAGVDSGSTGTININGGSLTTAYLLSGYYGTGTFTQSGGTVNVTSETDVGFNSTGYLTVNAGKFAPSASTTIFAGYNQAGAGHITVGGGTFNMPNYVYLGYSGTGTFSQSTGTVNSTNTTIYIGYKNGSSGSLSVSGGLFNALNLYLSYYSGSTGTLTITGGTVATSSLLKGNGATAFNFGGGVLQAAGSFTSAVALSLTGTNGNATIDTQGYTVTFSGSATGTGGLTKTGTGTLTFSVSSTVSYSGETAISAGTLKFLGSTSHLGDIAGAGTLIVGDGTYSSALTADSIKVSILTISAKSTITINALPGGPQSGAGDVESVPEPSTAMLLFPAGLIGVFILCYRPAKKGQSHFR